MKLQKLLIAQPDKAKIYGTPDQLDALTVGVKMRGMDTTVECVFARGRDTISLADFFYAYEIEAANKIITMARNMGLHVEVKTWVTDQK